MLCRVLGVSPSGYYAWVKRPPSQRRREDLLLGDHIVELHRDSHGIYERPRLHADLREKNIRISGKRLARSMRERGLVGATRRKYLVTTICDEGAKPSSDLIERPSPPTLPIGCGLLTSRISRPWRAFSFSPSFLSRATTTHVAGTRRSDISHRPNSSGAWLRPRMPPLEVKSKTLHQTEPASGSIPAQLRPKLRKRRDRIGAIVHRIRALQHPFVRI